MKELSKGHHQRREGGSLEGPSYEGQLEELGM